MLKPALELFPVPETMPAPGRPDGFSPVLLSEHGPEEFF
jgi:hypothetical protein